MYVCVSMCICVCVPPNLDMKRFSHCRPACLKFYADLLCTRTGAVSDKKGLIPIFNMSFPPYKLYVDTQSILQGPMHLSN